MQASGQQAQEAANQARAAAQDAAQQLRDQAQAIRDQAQAMREGVRNQITLVPPEVQMEQMRYQRQREQEKLVFAGFVVVMIASVLILAPLMRAFARRVDRSKGGGKAVVDDGSREQLQRIEQSIDAMAIEIERISEGQRFTTKLMSGREEALVPVGQRDELKRS